LINERDLVAIAIHPDVNRIALNQFI
jgi:hypothetical protein